MSTVPAELRLGERQPRQTEGLPIAARIYLAAIGLATIAAAAPLLPRIHSSTHGWTTFLVLSGLAAIAQVFVVRTVRDQSYHTSAAFLIAGALLLPPELVVLMGVVQHVPEWLKHRYPWYIQSFNICNYTLNGLAAWGAATLVMGASPAWPGNGPRMAVAGLAACLVFVLLNHVFVAGMLYLARG